MTTPKRYSLTFRNQTRIIETKEDQLIPVMEPFDNGEYIKYSDVAHLLDKDHKHKNSIRVFAAYGPDYDPHWKATSLIYTLAGQKANATLILDEEKKYE